MLLSLIALIVSQSQTASFTVGMDMRTPISPYIYGVNHPEWKDIGRGVTLARQGGNRMTAYNWETNASNAGNDWQHQNDGYLGETNEPGWTARTFMEAAQQKDAAVILTVPTNGYVSADKNGDGDVNKTPNYLSVRFHKSWAWKPGRNYVYPPDTKDKAVYQDEFVHFLESKKSSKTPVWYSLDNEPDLWHSTHKRITPRKPGYADIIANNIEFASAIKPVAPKALVFGPANYGWQGFRTFQDAPDANGRDFLDTYLAAMQKAEKEKGKRLVDVIDIHWYPEAQGDGKRIAFSNESETNGTHEARIQAPRSLWDPTYVETSWITKDSLKGEAIRLLPRIMDQIKKHYPGTKLSILEYNYGGGKHISGLIAQADVLGIFGKYGLFAACNWGLNPQDTAMVEGFRAFRDFDGKGGVFGNMGLAGRGGNPSENSLYAAIDERDSRITLVAINKVPEDRRFSVSLRPNSRKTARAFVRTANHPSGLPFDSDVLIEGSTVTFTLPGRSVATIELR